MGPQVELKQTYEILIGGLPFKLKSSHEPEVVAQLVAFVDQKINDALGASKSGSYQNSAVLAALNIAEELILLKRKADRELARLEEKVERLAHELENQKQSRPQ